MPDSAPAMTVPAAAAVQSAAPVKTSRFRTPGEGHSGAISVATVVTLLALWTIVTNMGWVKPLFLPTPQAGFEPFWQ